MSEPTQRLNSALADRYRIERQLGQGGMATVYLAQDLKHDRLVAIKILKPELAAVLGADRFVQEIKTTAALQHPHILPLFDSGSVGDAASGTTQFLYYVMPYIEGETLRDKLNRETQLGIDEAVKITTEVADALDYAHRHGVVHRDIKPENILLHDGRPMVADFGIALALSAAAGGRMTETGMSLGTPHYMSPEQATADKDITARSDVYSLASVLYEMLAGEPPHTGGSAQAIIMKIIAEPVKAVTQMRKSVPPNVAAALAKALEKLPADRFASAKEFADALTNPSFTVATTAAYAGGLTGRPLSRPKMYGAAALFFGLAGVALWGWLRPTPTPPETREHVVLGNPSGAGSVVLGAAIAPDGSAIVFVDSTGGKRQLWIKERKDLLPRPLTTLGTQQLPPGPSFSPDGQWVIYADGKLEKIARQGGTPIQLSDSAAGFGTTSLDDGTIVFIGGGQRVFSTSPAGGLTKLVITTTAKQLQGATLLSVTAVPHAHAVLLTALLGRPRVFALDLDSDSLHDIGVDAGVAWVVNGRLVYATTAGQLLVVPFDTRTLTAHGAPTSVLQGIRTINGVADVTLGRNGTLLYSEGAAVSLAGIAQIASVSRDGALTMLDTAWSGSGATNAGIALSPDGTRLALSTMDSTTTNTNVYVVRLATGIATRLTFDGTINLRTAWSPNGDTVLYVSDAGGKSDLWTKPADGSGRAAPVTLPEKRPVWEGTWSPDGKWLIYRTYDIAEGNGDIYAVRTTGDTTPIPLAATEAEETSPVISPDGRWLAYSSNATGRKEVYVKPFPNASDGIWQISSDGGTEPIWSHSGKELFYRNAAGEMIAVAVSGTPTFTPGKHTTLFNAQDYLADDDNHYYAVTPDDKRFLLLRPTNSLRTAKAGQLVLMRNWMGK